MVCVFQDKFDILKPKRWNVVAGLMAVFLNMIFSSYLRLEKLISINWVFRSLKFTKLSAPQLTILYRSSLREEIESTLEASLELDECLLGNIVVFILGK